MEPMLIDWDLLEEIKDSGVVRWGRRIKTDSSIQAEGRKVRWKSSCKCQKDINQVWRGGSVGAEDKPSGVASGWGKSLQPTKLCRTTEYTW